MSNKTICIDIDGTLVHYEEWKGEKHFGAIVEGASSATHKLHENGWYIIIYSTRANKELISRFLDDSKIEFDSINENPNQPENAKEVNLMQIFMLTIGLFALMGIGNKHLWK